MGSESTGYSIMKVTQNATVCALFAHSAFNLQAWSHMQNILSVNPFLCEFTKQNMNKGRTMALCQKLEFLPLQNTLAMCPVHYSMVDKRICNIMALGEKLISLNPKSLLVPQCTRAGKDYSSASADFANASLFSTNSCLFDTISQRLVLMGEMLVLMKPANWIKNN